MKNKPTLGSAVFSALLTWTVNFITLVLTGGPSITLPVRRDALDGTTPTRKLSRDAAQLWETRSCALFEVLFLFQVNG